MTAPPTWRTVQGRRRALRRRHVRPAERLGSVYDLLLYTALVGGLVVSGAATLAARAADLLAGTPVVAGDTRSWLAAAGAAAATGALLGVLLVTGPLTVGAAPATWVLSGPLDRARALTGRYAALLAACAALGSGCAAVLAVAGGAAEPAVVAAGGGAAGVALAGTAVLAQGRPAAETLLRRASAVLVGAAVLGTGALVAAARSGVAPPAAPAVDARVVAAALLVAAVAAAVAGLRALGGLELPVLSGGTAVLAAVTFGTGTGDLSLLGGVLQERRLRRRATVRSRHLPRGRRRALLHADLVRVLRSGPALGAWASWLVVPHLAGLLAPPDIVPAVQLLAATAATSRLASGLRAVAASRALRADLGGRDAELVGLHAVVPLAAAVVWTVPVVPSGGSVASLLLLPLAAVAVVVRFGTRPPPASGATLLDTPFGALPVELMRDASRGVLLFVVLAAVLVLCG